MTTNLLLPGTSVDFSAYTQTGGYRVLRAARTDIAGLRADLGRAVLTGLGGAHFPFARKMKLALASPGPRAVLCNVAEDEPGSAKDRTLLERNPHVVLEGVLLAAAAIEADVVVVYVAETAHAAVAALDQALAELRSATGLLSGVTVEVVTAPGAYVAGEASAAVRAARGEEAKPAQQPPYPTESGLRGRPTLVGNCETLANLPRIVAAAASDAENPNRERTRLATVTGDVVSATVVEIVPSDTTFGDLLLLAGGLGGDRPTLKAIQPGGPSSAYLPATAIGTALTNEAIVAAGSRPGCLAVRFLSASRCMVEELVDLTNFFAREQCGQCPPCRMKTQAYAQTITRIRRRQGDWSFVDQLRAVDEFVSGMPRRCALMSMPTPPVMSAIAFFREDFESHINREPCAATA